MNTYTEKLLSDDLLNRLALQLLEAYRKLIDSDSANNVLTNIGKNALFHFNIEGQNFEKLAIYFDVDDNYIYPEYGVNGIGYKGSASGKTDVVTNGLYSFKDNGKRIPVAPLIDWIKRHKITIPRVNKKVPSATQYAYMLSYSIKRHGIEPKHSMSKYLDANDNILEAIKLRILEIFLEETDKELEKINNE